MREEVHVYGVPCDVSIQERALPLSLLAKIKCNINKRTLCVIPTQDKLGKFLMLKEISCLCVNGYRTRKEYSQGNGKKEGLLMIERQGRQEKAN